MKMWMSYFSDKCRKCLVGQTNYSKTSMLDTGLTSAGKTLLLITATVMFVEVLNVLFDMGLDYSFMFQPWYYLLCVFFVGTLLVWALSTFSMWPLLIVMVAQAWMRLVMLTPVLEPCTNIDNPWISYVWYGLVSITSVAAVISVLSNSHLSNWSLVSHYFLAFSMSMFTFTPLLSLMVAYLGMF